MLVVDLRAITAAVTWQYKELILGLTLMARRYGGKRERCVVWTLDGSDLGAGVDRRGFDSRRRCGCSTRTLKAVRVEDVDEIGYGAS